VPELWLPDAEHYDLGDHAPTDGGPAKAIAHITWDRNATRAKPQPHVSFGRLLSYFTGAGRGSAPHILWDPFTGQLAQFYPANSRSKSVADKAGGTRTNRAGKVVIQVEAVFFPWTIYDGRAYEKLTDTPLKGWRELHAWIKSWGVPNSWPMGRPTSFDSNRSESVWRAKGGWYGHSQVPENDHQDPGTWPVFPRSTAKPKPPAAKPKPKPKPKPTARPYPAGIRPGSTRPSARPLQQALKRAGFMAASVVESDHYGPRTEASVAAFNKAKGFNSRGVTYDTGIGPKGWAALMKLAYGVQ
jgi:hypothetical protein